MVLFLYLVALLAIGGAVAAGVRHAKRDPRRRDLDTMPVVTAIGAAGVTLLVIAVQLSFQPTGELRAVLTAGVVCGGVITAVFAAWLNYRRYRVEESRQQVERDKADLEQSKHRLELEKVELEHLKDRREHAKVADESLMRAAEQLGHQDPRVRAGTLHALAGLAAHRPDRAAEVTELICMYLRTSPDDGRDGAAGEAQKVLLRVVLRANRAAQPVTELDIDLTGARLDGFTLDRVSLRALNLSRARLTGTTSLRGLRLTGGELGEGQAHQLTMDGAEFSGDVWLHGAQLRGLSAREARFHAGLSLEGSYVEQEVNLSDCVVEGAADLSGADLGTLTCYCAKFTDRFSLRRVSLRGGGSFVQTRFCRAYFEGFTCDNRVLLDQAHFEHTLRLHPNGMRDVLLRLTTLGSEVAGSDRCQLPPGWRVIPGDRDDVRYLVAS